MNNITGCVWKYGDNINTDIISPARYMEEDYITIGKHAMEGVDNNFYNKISNGDFIVAGNNFGSGSSRETAQIALKSAGISVVIAKSFARIFYRNSINVGLVVIELDECEKILEGDTLEIDLIRGSIYNISQDEVYYFSKYPDNIVEIINCGGLKKYISKTIIKNNI